MLYTDPLYGPYPIDDPAVLALLESEAIQRLKGVLQHGISALVKITQPTTRYEHSLGVMILVGRLGGSPKEQIAALLHDVSHTAFSHVIDYVFENHDGQNYHDELKEEFMAGSDLPRVLARYGYDWHDFLDESAYPLLEQPAPALCADRLDYFLRDCLDLHLAVPDEVANALEHLVVVQGRIAVDDPVWARWLADTYQAADEASWANFREVGIYELTARAIRYALASGILSQDDIWGTDARLWKLMTSAGDPKMQALVKPINATTRFIWDEEKPDFRVSTKLRTIDPDVLVDGGHQPLSAIEPEYGRRRQAYLESKQGKWPMRVVEGK